MKYKAVAEELINWVDKGIFNWLWYYMKDFRNYRILFVVEDISMSYLEPPIPHLDDQSLFLIGTLDYSGYKDYLGYRHPFVFDEFKNHPDYLRGSWEQKYNNTTVATAELVPDMGYLKSKPIMDIDNKYVVKLEETLFLLLNKHPKFNEFINAMQDRLYEINKSGDYYLNFLSEAKYSNSEYYNVFIGIDIEELDVYINLKPLYEEDSTLINAKELVKQGVPITKKIMSLDEKVIQNLEALERKFLNETFSQELALEYHKIIESIARLIYKSLYSKLENPIKQFDSDSTNISKKISDYKKECQKLINQIKRLKSEYKFLNVANIYYFLLLLLDNQINKNNSPISLEGSTFISQNLEEQELLKNASYYRNIIAHESEKRLDENQILISIYLYRQLILFLDKVYSFIKL